MATTAIYFRGGHHIIVDGGARDVATELCSDSLGRLVTIEGATIFANWCNVLYVEEITDGGGNVPPLVPSPESTGQTH
jgi:hypothetical protein